jgi:hypothetical protein
MTFMEFNGFVNKTQLVQDHVKCRALILTVLNLVISLISWLESAHWYNLT